MSRDSELADRVRLALADIAPCQEKAMFGGIAFMLNDHMLVAASKKRGLLVHVGPDHYDEALARPGARPVEMRGRTMTGYVFVDPTTLTGGALKHWLRQGVAFVRTLPPKPRRSVKRAAPARYSD
jgi:hypothetical protein